ncbi:MAG: MlaA family lipoprotein [Gammaproteobacteria bacterium]
MPAWTGRARRGLGLALALALAALALAGCAHTPPDDPSDPLEGLNRGVYGFNKVADTYVLRPVAKGYDAITPAPVRTGVRNFFSNLLYPTVIVNDLLQLKFRQFGQDTFRFAVNTLIGWGGLLDPATQFGFEEHSEDFGQTLGYWGVGPGWYLMIPFLGPSDNRDLIGSFGDWYTSPMTYIAEDHEAWAWGLGALQVIDGRASLLGADKMLEGQLDEYAFVRSLYLQDRLGKVHDGNPPKEEFDFGDEEEEEK